MELFNPTIAAPASLLVAFISYGVYLLFLHPLSGIPGPKLAALSRGWLVYHSRKGDMHRVMIDLHKKHGQLVRTGPDEVSVSDTQVVKQIYSAGTKFRKSDWYSVWQGRRKFDLFAERDERVHGSQRRLVSNIYSMNSLRELEGNVDRVMESFLDQMEKYAGSVIDMGKWVQLFAFDVVGEVTFSKTFDFVSAGQDDGSFSAIESALHSAAWIGQVPLLYWINDYLSPIIGNRLGIASRHGSLRTFAAEQVESRNFGKGSDSDDVLSRLNKVHAEKKEFDEQGVLSMATSNIFAGSDTTAISIRSVLYHLCKHPDAMKKLRAELTEARSQGKLSLPAKLAEAEALPYLQACLWEGLRVHPAVGMTLPRVVPEGGVVVDGTYIPKGYTIGANPWVIHRLPEIFGNDADTFRPDRWLEGDRGNMERYFFAFGAGARMCLGRNLSWMEMSKLIPTLLLTYNIELAEPEETWNETCWWFVKQEGLHIRLNAR